MTLAGIARTLFFAATLTLAGGTANARCDGGIICIHEQVNEDQLVLRAENLSNFPVTYTVEVADESSEKPQSVTRTIPARHSEVAMAVKQPKEGSSGPHDYSLNWSIGERNALHDEEHVYRLPYANGMSYPVIQSFGSRYTHTGLEQFAIDFRMPEGTSVHAARSGIVAHLQESNDVGCWKKGCGAYANYVVILHNDGTTGQYYHLLQDGVLVEVGDRVQAGQKIALSGNTGHTTEAHLHFAVYRAVSRGNTQSVPVRFVSADGIVDRPRLGGRYQATSPKRPSPDRLQSLNRAAGE